MKASLTNQKNVLNLNSVAARTYFLSPESYSNIELPSYFSFQKVLLEIENKFEQKELNLQELIAAKQYETVNHVLYGNKDGKYAWRKYQLVNPLLYVSLVNIITDKNNWEFIQARFNSLKNIENIKCESIPVLPKNKQSQKASQISQWVNNVEKKSIALSLEYNFLYHTDISDCYDSMYTHSISWAIHSKKTAKEKRGFNELFSNKIDHHLQAMSNGQTNGIPTGSILMDFIAEIVLAYADHELSAKLDESLKEKKFHILRFRDDYRIFVNDISDGDLILKKLSETLIDLGFRLNMNKTLFNQDVVGGSIKEDKVDSLKFDLVPKILTKPELLRQLLIIHQIGKKFPNSGILKTRLSKILEIVNSANIKNQEETLIGILVDVSFNNPNCFPLIAGLVSNFISGLPKPQQIDILRKIQYKICTLSNVGLLELWMQNIALCLKVKLSFNEVLCRYVYDDFTQKLFITDWIAPQDNLIKEIINNSNYVEKPMISKIKPKIDISDIQIFSYEN